MSWLLVCDVIESLSGSEREREREKEEDSVRDTELSRELGRAMSLGDNGCIRLS